ncbi:MAG: tetratricopeptide repeat protein [Bacteroidales bacterium]|nr:tetratricopeptide repeat protein [Bacteroidales bacterium]
MITRIIKYRTKIQAAAMVGCVILAMTAAGCRSGKGAATPAQGKYTRQPIVETTTERLNQEVAIVEAKMQQELGNNKEAAAIYRRVLRDDATCAAAYYELSRIMADEQRIDSAIVTARQAVTLDANNKWYKLHLASLYEASHQTHLLTQLLESLVAQNPTTLDYYYDLSNAYISDRNLPKAIETLNRVERLTGVTEPISLQKQRLWEALGKPDKGLKEIEALAAAMPQDKKYNAMLAESCMKQKNYTAAKQYYDKILAADPDDEYIHISLANYYKTTHQPEAAYQELQRGFANPALPCSEKISLLRSFYSLEEFMGSQSQKASALMETAIAQCEDPSSYADTYANLLFLLQRYKDAVPQYLTAIGRDSSQYLLWEGLLISMSNLVYQNNDSSYRDQLQQYSKRANRLFPTHTLPYYTLALDADAKKDHAEAIKLLRRCTMVGFNKGYLESECYMLLTNSLYSNGQFDEAFATYEAYLKKHPDDMWMLNNYAYELAEQGQQLDKAEQLSRKTIAAEPKNISFLDTYAWILHKMGRRDEAKKYIQQAVDLSRPSETPSKTILNHYNAIMGN